MGEYSFNLKQVIDHFVFKNSFVVELPNLCFIDTPGFDPGNDTETDNETAIEAITTSDALFWCFDVSSGTLKDSEIDILYDIHSRKPELKIYIIANKADIKSLDENEEILSSVENSLLDNTIDFAGISLYSSKNIFTKQDASFASSTRKKSIADFLADFSAANTEKESVLKKSVGEVFSLYIAADKERIERNKKMLKGLNSIDSLISTSISALDSEVAYYKGRMDKKWRGKTISSATTSTENDNVSPEQIAAIATAIKNSKNLAGTATENFSADDAEESISEILEEIKMHYSATIAKDKSDIEKAQELSSRMQKCIESVFAKNAASKEEPK